MVYYGYAFVFNYSLGILLVTYTMIPLLMIVLNNHIFKDSVILKQTELILVSFNPFRTIQHFEWYDTVAR